MINRGSNVHVFWRVRGDVSVQLISVGFCCKKSCERLVFLCMVEWL